MPCTFLSFRDAGIDVVEQARHKCMALGVGDVVGVVREVAYHFVAAIDPDGGEVVVKPR